MRIATFNVNSVRSRLPVLQRWLPDAAVDILCLQETKAQDSDFPLAEVEDLGYQVAFAGEKSYNGVAIFSSQAADEVVHGFCDGAEPNNETRLIAARFNDLWVINTYVPQGKSIEHDDYQYKRIFLDRVARLMKDHEGRKALWLGDLNVAPTELDVTNPKSKKDHVCFTAELRQQFAAITEPLTDLFRQFHPDEQQFSFYDYRVKGALENNRGWRIDHMLATPELARLCTNCWIDKEPRTWEKPSDHTPVLADFAL